MNKITLSLAMVLTLSVAAFSQKLPKPTQLPVAPTAEQESVVQLASSLHDAKKYDEAIALYDKLLSQNPDLTLALYEKALSLYTKGDLTKAMETAYAGSKYKADELPLFYALIANCLDDVGKPDEAIKIYREAEGILKADVGTQRFLASVYYNLGITYFRIKKYPEARAEMKKAIENNAGYGSPHYVLANIYFGTGYKVPAFLAALRLISLELNSQRSQTSARMVTSILQPAAKDPKSGNISINLNLGAPTDEGDYTMYEMLMGTLTTFTDEKNKGQTEEQKFVAAIDTMLTMLVEDKKLKDTFVGKNYVPFAAEVKKKGYSEVLGYLVLLVSGNQKAEAWLKNNDAKIGEFAAWAKNYKPG